VWQQKQYDVKQSLSAEFCHKVEFKLLLDSTSQQPLSAALLQLQRGDLIPPDAEISTMNKFVEMMKPFINMTEGIGGEKWVKISCSSLDTKITSFFFTDI